MSYRAEKTFSAPPEVVFNVATDRDRLSRWLPECLRAEDADMEYRLAVLPERLRARFHHTGRDGWSGFLQVRENPAGGCTAEACVAATGRAGDSLGADQVIKLLDNALASLHAEVADDLTVG